MTDPVRPVAPREVTVIADALQAHGRKASSGEPLFFDRRNLEDVIAKALVAAPVPCAASPADPWQPIETAPRDTALLVALIQDGKVMRVSDAKRNSVGFYSLNGGHACHWRTHWAPMPRATGVGARDEGMEAPMADNQAGGLDDGRLDRSTPDVGGAEAADRGETYTAPKGTYNCPVCGWNVPHSEHAGEIIERLGSDLDRWQRWWLHVASMLRGGIRPGCSSSVAQRNCDDLIAGRGASMIAPFNRSDAPPGAVARDPHRLLREIVERHRRQIERSPGVGADVQRYGLAVCEDILSDLDCARLRGEATVRPDDVDVQLLAWAVSNCHTLARRRLNALRQRVPLDALLEKELESWGHVQRICEKAGAKSAGVLRASLPTEITDGSATVRVEE